jgi:death-on-curing protein
MKEPRWLTADIVLAIHAQLLAEHGGSAGLRDRGALESALGKPRNRFAYGKAALPDLAASLAFGLGRNHPFVDGNKRVALACLDVFLQLQGRELVAPEVEAADTILALAEGSLTEKALAAWVRRRTKKLPATPRS